QLRPVADGQVVGLAHGPDVAGVDVVLNSDVAGIVHDPHLPGGGDFEGLVVRPVLRRCLGHEADVGHRAHRRWIEGAVRPAVVDHGLVDAGVTAVGNDGVGVFFAAGRA